MANEADKKDMVEQAAADFFIKHFTGFHPNVPDDIPIEIVIDTFKAGASYERDKGFNEAIDEIIELVDCNIGKFISNGAANQFVVKIKSLKKG